MVPVLVFCQYSLQHYSYVTADCNRSIVPEVNVFVCNHMNGNIICVQM